MATNQYITAVYTLYGFVVLNNSATADELVAQLTATRDAVVVWNGDATIASAYRRTVELFKSLPPSKVVLSALQDWARSHFEHQGAVALPPRPPVYVFSNGTHGIRYRLERFVLPGSYVVQVHNNLYTPHVKLPLNWKPVPEFKAPVKKDFFLLPPMSTCWPKEGSPARQAERNPAHYASIGFFSLVLCHKTFGCLEPCSKPSCPARHEPLTPDEVRWIGQGMQDIVKAFWHDYSHNFAPGMYGLRDNNAEKERVYRDLHKISPGSQPSQSAFVLYNGGVRGRPHAADYPHVIPFATVDGEVDEDTWKQCREIFRAFHCHHGNQSMIDQYPDEVWTDFSRATLA